jgi:hypothetical protein
MNVETSWVLVILLFSEPGGGVAISHVDGYQSLKQCESAAAATNSATEYKFREMKVAPSSVVFCIPGPRR